MKNRGTLVFIVTALALSAVVAVAAGSVGPPTPRHPGPPSRYPGPTPRPGPTVTISGAPGNGLIAFAPLKLTTAQLAAVPAADQQTETVTINGVKTTESGPLLSYLLTRAGSQYIAACKNDELRYWIQATGNNGSAAVITAAEIDPSFGDNPAILSVSENGKPLTSPRLIVANDATDARDIQQVTNVTIGRAAPQLAGSESDTAACTPTPFTAPVTPTPPDGSVVINGDVAHPMTLTYAELQALPQVTQTDTYEGSHGASTNTETGPTLFDVLSAAEPKFQFCTANDDVRFYVEVTSSEDGYAALVSWAEIDPVYNGDQVLLSLTENGKQTDLSSPTGTGDTDPRLTVPGDVKGGRYNYGSAVITVFRAPQADPGCGPRSTPLPEHR